MTPDNVKEVCLYAWVGEDELGSGQVGLKQALAACGMVPLVAVSESKISQEYIQRQLQQQSNAHGKTIRLCKFIFVEEIITLEPSSA